MRVRYEGIGVGILLGCVYEKIYSIVRSKVLQYVCDERKFIVQSEQAMLVL